MTLLDELLRHLHPQPIAETTFRGQSQDLGWGRIFGGQVLAQGAAASGARTDPARDLRSLHASFLRPGDPSKPVDYEVETLREGRSVTTHAVHCRQEERLIAHLTTSFQVRERGVTHQVEMPRAPEPGTLLSEQDLGRRARDRLPAEIWAKVPEPLRARAVGPRPIEIRPVAPINPLNPRPCPPVRQAWLRAASPVDGPSARHRLLLAYASDFHLLLTALQPHGISWMSRSVKVASIDHAIWFHRPFRIDGWLLYDLESPNASAARGLVSGRVFTPDGKLVASVAQEGLIRGNPAGAVTE